MHVHSLQVGSHIGNTANDPLFKYLANSQETGLNVILIEPVPYLFQQLQEQYKTLKLKHNITFLNIAISDNVGEIKLYIPSQKNDFTKYPSWLDQLGSSNKNHILQHANCLNVIIDEISVPCSTLNQLVKDYDIQSIDYLLTDTEGHDYSILMNLDLSSIKPKNIIFENSHMDGVYRRNIRYGALISHFTNNNYKIVIENNEDTHIQFD